LQLWKPRTAPTRAADEGIATPRKRFMVRATDISAREVYRLWVVVMDWYGWLVLSMSPVVVNVIRKRVEREKREL
jgi:hypothetical protein